MCAKAWRLMFFAYVLRLIIIYIQLTSKGFGDADIRAVVGLY